MLVVEGDMTIIESAALKHELMEHMPENGNLTLDLSGVEDMDCAGFQLMQMTRTVALSRGVKLSIAAHSKATARIVSMFGEQQSFGQIQQPGQ